MTPAPKSEHPVRVDVSVTANPPLQGIVIPPSIRATVNLDDLAAFVAPLIAAGVRGELRALVDSLDFGEPITARDIWGWLNDGAPRGSALMSKFAGWTDAELSAARYCFSVSTAQMPAQLHAEVCAVMASRAPREPATGGGPTEVPKMLPRDYKKDERPKRGMWAPGDYMGECRKCGVGFWGDKRAMSCADCAYADPPSTPPPGVPMGYREAAADYTYQCDPGHGATPSTPAPAEPGALAAQLRRWAESEGRIIPWRAAHDAADELDRKDAALAALQKRVRELEEGK